MDKTTCKTLFYFNRETSEPFYQNVQGAQTSHRCLPHSKHPDCVNKVLGQFLCKFTSPLWQPILENFQFELLKIQCLRIHLFILIQVLIKSIQKYYCIKKKRVYPRVLFSQYYPLYFYLETFQRGHQIYKPKYLFALKFT